MGLAFVALVLAFLFTGIEPLAWAAVALVPMAVIIGVGMTVLHVSRD